MTYRPLFRFPGSKWRLMPKYISLFPEHRHYISVFGGSATDLFRKRPSPQETFNDLDQIIVTVFEVLQDDRLVEQVKRKIAIPHCRLLFCDALSVISSDIADPVTAAAAFLTVAGQGMCSSHRRKSRETAWTVHSRLEHLAGWLRMPETINLDRCRLTGVNLRNEHCLALIQELDAPDAFFFLDPPYFGVDPLYAVTMSGEDHWRLLQLLHTIKGRAMLCGYRNPLYDNLLTDWHRHEFDVVTTLDMQGNRTKRKETVWCNYDPATTKLWTP